MEFLGGFARAVARLKKDPFACRKKANLFRDAKPNFCPGWGDIQLSSINFSCCGVPVAKLKEIAPILLGFDDTQYGLLKSVVEHLEHEEKKLTEEEFLQTLAYFGAFGTFAMLFCDEMELLFEMYRRSAEAGKAVYYGEWLGPETIVCPGEFFKWAEDQGFPPTRRSCPNNKTERNRTGRTRADKPEQSAG